jgi:hypothetical protein
MRAAPRLAVLAYGVMLLSACSTGETTVLGAGETGPSGATATGPTAATGSDPGLEGAVSLSIPSGKNPTGAALYSCDGVTGTWVYEPGELPVESLEFTIEAAPFDMSGGTGTLVIEGSVAIPGAGEAGFTDTIELEIQGTADSPTMVSTGVKVEATGAIEGVPIDFAQFFPENESFAIVPGAPQC